MMTEDLNGALLFFFSYAVLLLCKTLMEWLTALLLIHCKKVMSLIPFCVEFARSPHACVLRFPPQSKAMQINSAGYSKLPAGLNGCPVID